MFSAHPWIIIRVRYDHTLLFQLCLCRICTSATARSSCDYRSQPWRRKPMNGFLSAISIFGAYVVACHQQERWKERWMHFVSPIDRLEIARPPCIVRLRFANRRSIPRLSTLPLEATRCMTDLLASKSGDIEKKKERTIVTVLASKEQFWSMDRVSQVWEAIEWFLCKKELRLLYLSWVFVTSNEVINKTVTIMRAYLGV